MIRCLGLFNFGSIFCFSPPSAVCCFAVPPIVQLPCHYGCFHSLPGPSSVTAHLNPSRFSSPLMLWVVPLYMHLVASPGSFLHRFPLEG
ncbi:hypothetical protein K435DRAFT_517573 [Dendrothele bispora CBS 962.96]|uniref:Secreted protein n=1 Tax=Dendrothele bispora (strain CBS 962.96) TaxID=1314807 RepID=A0A4S8MAE7_DENBC|nr:hypothetical protein K435DRAFT_517573 [Dendrothele bispora CBS 962.96]